MFLKISLSFRLSTFKEGFTLFGTVLILLGEVSVEVDPVCVLAATRAEAEKAAAPIARALG